MLKEKNKRTLDITLKILIITVSAVISALGIHVFILPNDFASIGVDGISVMLQSLTGFSAAYYGLIINIPLLIAGWFYINRRYVVYTVIFTLLNSAFLLVLEKIDFYQSFAEASFVALDALFAGVILGVRAAIMLRIGGSTGGLDIVVVLLQKKFAYINFDKLMFMCNLFILGAAFFVYGFNLYAVLLSVVCAFAYSRVLNVLLEGPKTALEFKIITNEPEKLAGIIIKELRHSVTICKAEGGYTSDEKAIMFCVVNRREIADFQKIIQKSNAFAYISEVRGVIGNFRRGKNEEPR